MANKPDPTAAARKLGAERQRRMRAKRQTYEKTLLQIRDERAIIRTLDDAIAAAAVALAKRHEQERI